MFVNLVDKKNEQGALGEAFDAALAAVQAGAGVEGAPDEGESSGSLSGAAGGGSRSGSSTSKAAAAVVERTKEEEVGRDDGAGRQELAGSLRHVWFDFHHEVRCWSAMWLRRWRRCRKETGRGATPKMLV